MSLNGCYKDWRKFQWYTSAPVLYHYDIAEIERTLWGCTEKDSWACQVNAWNSDLADNGHCCIFFSGILILKHFTKGQKNDYNYVEIFLG